MRFQGSFERMPRSVPTGVPNPNTSRSWSLPRRWLPQEFGFAANQQQTFLVDAVVQAIVTHVYLEWIHPFGDGNGRTGRLLEFYILLRWGIRHRVPHSVELLQPDPTRVLPPAGSGQPDERLDSVSAIRHSGLPRWLEAGHGRDCRQQFGGGVKHLVHATFAQRLLPEEDGLPTPSSACVGNASNHGALA